MDRDPQQRLGSCSRDAEAIKSHPFFSDINWQKIKNKEYPVPPPTIIHKNNKIEFSQSIIQDIINKQENTKSFI